MEWSGVGYLTTNFYGETFYSSLEESAKNQVWGWGGGGGGGGGEGVKPLEEK